MKPHWHETIQQYVDGQSSAEAAAALREALSEDAELRAVYLDYINLDVALGALADAAAVEENGSNQITTLREARSGSPPHYWRWAGAAAAFAALVAFAMLPRVPKPLRTGQDVAVDWPQDRSSCTENGNTRSCRRNRSESRMRYDFLRLQVKVRRNCN